MTCLLIEQMLNRAKVVLSKWTKTVINNVYRANDMFSHRVNDVKSRCHIEQMELEQMELEKVS